MAHATAHDTDPHAPAHAHVPGDDLPHHGTKLDEPRSPVWLPVLGLVVLATVIVWWLSLPNDVDEAAAAAASASASSSIVPPASATAPEGPPQPALTAKNAPPRPPPLPSGMQPLPGARLNPFRQP